MKKWVLLQSRYLRLQLSFPPECKKINEIQHCDAAYDGLKSDCKGASILVTLMQEDGVFADLSLDEIE